jgi:hypothetical protein
MEEECSTADLVPRNDDFTTIVGQEFHRCLMGLAKKGRHHATGKKTDRKAFLPSRRDPFKKRGREERVSPVREQP